MYLVEIGGIEVTVTLVLLGSVDFGLDPKFEVDAGTDWDGTPVDLSYEDRMTVIAWVMENYPDEVYQ